MKKCPVTVESTYPEGIAVAEIVLVTGPCELAALKESGTKLQESVGSSLSCCWAALATLDFACRMLRLIAASGRLSERPAV